MKNREKYTNQIVDMAINNIAIAVDKNGRLCDCNKIRCDDCIGCYSKNCKDIIKEWFEQEYEEPKVDWSKVPVDTKILVKSKHGEEWYKRHFANYVNGTVYAWDSGTTSYTSDMYSEHAVPWDYAKLAENNV